MNLKNYNSVRSEPTPRSRTIETYLADCGVSELQRSLTGASRWRCPFILRWREGPSLCGCPPTWTWFQSSSGGYRDQPRSPPRKRRKISASRRAAQAWKIQQDWVQVQMSLIKLKQADFLQVFLSVHSDARRTFYRADCTAQSSRHCPNQPSNQPQSLTCPRLPSRRLIPARTAASPWIRPGGKPCCVPMPETERDLIARLKQISLPDDYDAVFYLEDLVKHMGAGIPASTMAVYASNWGFIKGAIHYSGSPLHLVIRCTWAESLGLGVAKGLVKPSGRTN